MVMHNGSQISMQIFDNIVVSGLRNGYFNQKRMPVSS